MSSIGTYLALCLALIAGGAKAEGCSHNEAYAAETVTSYLDSWRNMKLGYVQFKQCDDGAIGDGFSEAVARLLADQWTQLAQFMKYASEDAGFERFVLSHIDSTVHPRDLEKIGRLARTQCPDGAVELCGKIAARSKEALAKQ